MKLSKPHLIEGVIVSKGTEVIVQSKEDRMKEAIMREFKSAIGVSDTIVRIARKFGDDYSLVGDKIILFEETGEMMFTDGKMLITNAKNIDNIDSYTKLYFDIKTSVITDAPDREVKTFGRVINSAESGNKIVIEKDFYKELASIRIDRASRMIFKGNDCIVIDSSGSILGKISEKCISTGNDQIAFSAHYIKYLKPAKISFGSEEKPVFIEDSYFLKLSGYTTILMTVRTDYDFDKLNNLYNNGMR